MTQDQIFQLPNRRSDGGVLCIAEGETVPFEIARVYYTTGEKRGTVRGHHAHKTLEQILICVHGEIEVSLDDGKSVPTKHTLKAPCDALYVGARTWRTMEWTLDDSVLLVLASQLYDESDYIRDYDEFAAWVRREKNV